MLRLDPKQLEGSYPLGQVLAMAVAAIQEKQAGRAEFICRQLIGLMPGLEEAYHPLFVVLNEAARFDELEHVARTCLASSPRHIPAYINLSLALRKRQAHDQARIVLEKALKLDPANAGLLNHLGILQKDCGDLDQALESFNRCLKLKPGLSEAYWNRAELYKTISDDELTAMSARGDQEDKPASVRARFYYSVARAYEHRGDYPRCFEFLTKGAQQKRADIVYDHQGELAELQRIPEVFSHSVIAGTGSGLTSEAPIFICGLPRSGTTLIEQIISCHDEITAGEEIPALLEASSQLLQRKRLQDTYPEWVPQLKAGDWREIGEGYLHRTRLLQSRRHFSDKMLLNYKAIGLIQMALPNAKIIHCMRHPLDNILGCYRQLFASGQRFTYDLDELCDIYIAYRQLMAHWHQLSPGRILDVHYEDLVVDLEGQSRRVLEHIGLPWDAACLQFHTNDRPVMTTSSTQVRQPIFTSGLAYWRHFEQQLAPVSERLGDYL